jgi:hypothetical protein
MTVWMSAYSHKRTFDRYHESLDNLTSADVYFGQAQLAQILR